MKEEPPGENTITRCEDIQALLFNYVTRELGQARSDLVREHLRKCEKCQAVAKDIQATMNFLRTASKSETVVSDHLSKERRTRIIRAFAHPVIDWIDRHHIIVSVVVTMAVIIVLIVILRRMEVWKAREPEGITVTIGRPAGQRSEVKDQTPPSR